MPFATADDGVRLSYEETGTGEAIVLVHEFAGDMRSWEPQMRHFGRMYRCIAYNARGYPPSDVPEKSTSYSQARAADDIKAVLDAAGVERAHVVGLSMGGFATLHFGFRHPARARSLCVGGCGYGAEPDQRARFRLRRTASPEAHHGIRNGKIRRRLCLWSTRAIPEQGSAVLRSSRGCSPSIPRSARQYAARRPAQAPFTLWSGRRDEEAHRRR